ncbi:carbonic anhydrase [Anaerolineales bacterium]
MLKTEQEKALQALMQGNARYVNMRLHHPNQTSSRRQRLVDGQNPIAVVVGCSDSRVPLEIVFDQGLGDLFVIRVAGNVIDNMVMASIEFAVFKLDVPLLMIMGHSQCGAIQATFGDIDELPGFLPELSERILPSMSLDNTLTYDEQVYQAVRANARRSAKQVIRRSQIISDALAANKLGVASSYYDLESGQVELLTEIGFHN